MDYLINENDFKIGKCLGRGSYASVFLVQNLKTQEISALKKFHSNFANDKYRELFLREVDVMIKSKHPCLLSLKGYYIPPKESDNLPLILTDYMPNKDLLSVLTEECKGNKPNGWNDIKKDIVAFGSAVGMAYFHNLGGLHRDLKPANIMLNSDFEPKIADFGLSKISDDSTQSIIAGSPFWMAPELFEREQYDQKVDVYAYGVILYQLFTGQVLFNEKISTFELGKKVINGERPIIPDYVSNFYNKLIQLCWHQDPNQRPTFLQIVNYFLNSKENNLLNLEFINFKNKIYLNINNNDSSFEQANKLFLNCDYISSGKIYYELIQKGHLDSYYKLGLMFINGIGISQNQRQGAIYLKEAADKGHILSCYECGKLLYFGNGVNMNKSLSFYYFSLSAKNNHKESILKISEMYFKGEGINQDINKSKELLNNLIQIGDIRAFKLYLNYFENLNLFEDTINNLNSDDKIKIKQSIEILKYLAEFNHIESQYLCGILLFEGIKVKRNILKASVYFFKAAINGHSESQFQCSKLLINNNEIQTDFYKSSYFLKLAANQKHLESIYNFGCYLDEGIGIPQNKYLANQFFRFSADLGYTKSQTILGYRLENGIGENINYLEAIKYYELASKDLDLNALCNLGKMFEEGKGVEINLLKATECYRSAALMGNTTAMYNYALMLETGSGIEINILESLKFYKMASDRGSIESCINYLNLIIKDLKKYSLDEALYYAKLTADQNHMKGLYIYGFLLYYYNKDLIGLNFIKKSANLGYHRAIEFLKKNKVSL